MVDSFSVDFIGFGSMSSLGDVSATVVCSGSLAYLERRCR